MLSAFGVDHGEEFGKAGLNAFKPLKNAATALKPAATGMKQFAGMQKPRLGQATAGMRAGLGGAQAGPGAIRSTFNSGMQAGGAMRRAAPAMGAGAAGGAGGFLAGRQSTNQQKLRQYR